MVDVHIAMIEPCDRAFADHDVVDRVVLGYGSIVAEDLAVDHGAGLDVAPLRSNPFQSGI